MLHTADGVWVWVWAAEIIKSDVTRTTFIRIKPVERSASHKLMAYILSPRDLVGYPHWKIDDHIQGYRRCL